MRFWRANAATLARAEAEYGVPAEIIVGIVGVETIYGRNMGNFRVIDALATLSFDFPQAPSARGASARPSSAASSRASSAPRAAPPKTRWCRVGSYAGAMGMPQFMPSSIAKYAVDFDGDGRIDLINSPADVIGSVASYFKGYGWQPGMPSHLPGALRRGAAQEGGAAGARHPAQLQRRQLRGRRRAARGRGAAPQRACWR